jgi:glycosyltransferase involved in cell wall biosynthesis
VVSRSNSTDRIVFLIRSLHAGGAERQLVHLAAGLNKIGFDVTVIAMYSGGGLEPDLRASQAVEYITLEKKGRTDILGFGARLIREVMRRKPDIVHGFMPFANELALVAGRVSRAKVVWGIRSSFVDFQHYDAPTRLLFSSGRLLSGLPDLIIANSWAGRDYHVKAGYHAENTIVIPNGIDSDQFHPDPVARLRLRARWGLPGDAPVVGIVGRIEPMKGYAVFLQAAALVSARNPARFVCIGDGDPRYRREMEAQAEAAGCSDRVHWLGMCNDMPSAYAAMDVLVSASLGEGFSNVIGEAMASGVRCVVTDVGDSARIVGATGIVVPPGSADSMAKGILDVLGGVRNGSDNPRDQITKHFSLERMVNLTATTLRSLFLRDGVSPMVRRPAAPLNLP